MIFRLLALLALCLPAAAQAQSRTEIERTMRRATDYMVEHVADHGGYVWSYLPDMSRRWGEMEAEPGMIWVQAPGTATMGHLFLDAFNATGDRFYYDAAARAADALIAGQHRSGGWNYFVHTGGPMAARRWYVRIGRNGWRLEEFQHYYGNATYDDSCTADCAKFMLRMYLEKREPRYRASLDKVLGFVLASQYPVGGWPQRFPLRDEFHDHGLPDYTSFITFNDDVAAENIVFLLMVWQTLGDRRVLDPIARAMDCFVRAQQPQPQPGWGLQHTVADLKPASARTYEPKALVSHTTATNVALMMDFYELTGEQKFLRRLPEALDWLDSIRLPASIDPQRRYPTFTEVGTNTPMYIHRRGSDVVNGEYYHDDNPHNTIAHYSSFRSPDVAKLRARHAALSARPVAEVIAGSALKGDRQPLPRYFTLGDVTIGDLKTTAPRTITPGAPDEIAATLAALDGDHRWVTPLHTTSHIYTRDGYEKPVPGDFSHTYVGDDTDTSPYPDPQPVPGISTAVFAKNMAVLIRARAAT